MLKYVQSQEGVFLRHIHDVEPTQWDEDTFCFARKLTPEQVLRFGVTKLRIVTPPYFDPATQKREEGPAIFENGTWVQQYVVTEMDTEEALAKGADQAHVVREERDRLLVSCDWTQVADVPVDKAAWAAYRQLLREIPLQEGFPWEVIWPDAP
jgi:hypothetical protein